MKLSIIMPVYNEISTMAESIRRVLNAPVECAKELIIVDDCSTDGTRKYLVDLVSSAESAGEDGELKILFHDRNLGKGAAIRTALEHATGQAILIQDADLEYDPQDYARLLQPINDGRADVVFGNRFHGGAHRVLYFWHCVANHVLTTLCNMMTNLNLSDMEVGYKVFRTEVFKSIRIRSDRFGFEPEITIKVAKLGCRIYEVPISYHGRTYAEGKKIGWRDGLAALCHILYYRFFDRG
ncbi:MAG TPA: glycosyltransferase family 2 protein [Candidatus Tectomicrobia bacterium]|nr:glycosyltransferase family 2 protein [Candidatus Tectomicrobia bacterium]